MWTGKMAFTRRPVCRLRNICPSQWQRSSRKSITPSGSICQYLGSASMKTGHAPKYRIALAGAMKVSDETSTSSSASTPASMRAMCRAAVPLTVAIAYFVPGALGHHFLEAVDIASDRRDPVRIKAFLNVLPLVPANFRDDQGYDVRGGRRTWGEFFFQAQFRYLPSPKLPITLLPTSCATSSIP